MLRPRIIPCLLVHDKGLTKTVKFGPGKYVGDPINAVRIFNEKEVDELIVLDIDATVEQRAPDMHLIKSLATECRMPLSYGGGISTVDQVRQIISLGVEKVALSAAAIQNPKLISEAAKTVGSQSIVIVLDVKKSFWGKYEVFTHNGKKSTGRDVFELAKMVEDQGAGELVINSIDRDGVMKGYDYELIKKVRELVDIPITALGGAGSLQDIAKLIKQHHVIGAAAGSLFVFKGIYKAVLINYPTLAERTKLINESKFIVS